MRHCARRRYRSWLAARVHHNGGGAAEESAAAEAAEAAGGSRSPEDAGAVELAHHDGRAVPLEESEARGPKEELAAGIVLLKRGAHSYPVDDTEIPDNAST